MHYGYAPYDEMVKKYDPAKLKDGWNTVDGQEIYYISNPALGLLGGPKEIREIKNLPPVCDAFHSRGRFLSD